jgi:hypothetical protein
LSTLTQRGQIADSPWLRPGVPGLLRLGPQGIGGVRRGARCRPAHCRSRRQGLARVLDASARRDAERQRAPSGSSNCSTPSPAGPSRSSRRPPRRPASFPRRGRIVGRATDVTRRDATSRRWRASFRQPCDARASDNRMVRWPVHRCASLFYAGLRRSCSCLKLRARSKPRTASWRSSGFMFTEARSAREAERSRRERPFDVCDALSALPNAAERHPVDVRRGSRPHSWPEWIVARSFAAISATVYSSPSRRRRRVLANEPMCA